VLDGYGVFFHVEVPEMQQSLVMSVTTLERDLALAGALKSVWSAIGDMPDSAARVQGEQAIKRLQLLLGPMPQLAEPPQGPVIPTGLTPVADLDPSMPLLRDPSGVYREAIKAALIDAMLEHSRGMNIRADEWLTVAAHRGEGPLGPNEIVNSSTLVLRVKGSDLALYDADRTRKEEVRARVEAREF
jgi:hypothetical protein